jgi:sulfite exporter TauE/SafE/copper chaperone CopZ
MTDAPASSRIFHAAIEGMHCGNCVIAVERILRALPGVTEVRASYPPGGASVTIEGEPDRAVFETALKAQGYTLTSLSEGVPTPSGHVRGAVEVAAAFAILLGIAIALQHFQLLPRAFNVSDQMSYGLAFLIGLVASVSSCLAVTGGLLVAFAAKYNEANPYLSDRQRLIPPLYFNVGRLVSYTLLGGAIGALGASLTLSPAASGVLTLIASLLMILIGLNMIGVFPSVRRFLPTLPTRWSHRLHDAAATETKGTAFVLGAATFFFPCGFTQALQLYVLSKASFTIGALTMLAFAIGTLPALLSLSAVSSLAKGAFQKHFLRFAGAAVILLGVFNIQYGLVLTGSETARPAQAEPAAAIAEMVPGSNLQRISMKVVDLEYAPHQFVVKQGVPVEWWIDGSQAEGCGRVLLAPQLGIRKILSDTSTTLISFTPNAVGDFAFNCGMGMMTPNSKITVLPKG